MSSCFIGQNRFVLYAATLIRFSNKDAKKIVSEVGGVISKWQAVAHQHNAPAREIEYLSGALEHEDLEQAKNYERKIIRCPARNFLAEMSLASRIANKFGNFVVG